MSTQETGANVPGEKPKGMAKFRRRVSRILGKDDVKRATAGTSTAAPSTAAPSAAAASSAPPATTSAPSKSEEAPAVVAATAPVPPKSSASTKPALVALRPKSAATPAENAKIQEDRVKAMFAKYNMTLEVGEWTQPFKMDIPRVEKKVRMRVHRTCHRCQTQYGIDKTCTNCNHTRCKKCPRYPGQKKAIKGKEASGPGEAGYVKKPITQRSRKLCHKCQTPFKSKSAQCETCQHERCALCPRDAPRSTTAPALLTTTWTCHECQNVHRDPENPCLKCGHGKCEDCPRDKVRKKVEPSGTGGLVEVEERMKKMEVSPQASAA